MIGSEGPLSEVPLYIHTHSIKNNLALKEDNLSTKSPAPRDFVV